MSIITKFTLLILLFLYSCSSKKEKTKVTNPKIEFEIINTVLPSIIPKEYPCTLAIIENESSESYDLRLRELYHKIDSVGLRVLIINKLVCVDSIILHSGDNFHNTSISQLLANAESEEKLLDKKLITDPNKIKVQFVNKVLSEENDCYTLGQFTFSRVGFNKDSTEAALIYNIRTGYHVFINDVIRLKRIGEGKWEIVE